MSSSAVVVCTWGGSREGLPGGAEEVLTLGRKVSAALQGELTWLVLGPLPEGTEEVAERHGVASLERVADPSLESFQADPTVEALAQVFSDGRPRALLFRQTFDSRLVAPRLAGRLGFAVVMNGVDMEVGAEGALQVTASAYGGDTRVVYEVARAASCAVAVMPDAVAPEPAEGGPPAPVVRDIPLDLSQAGERIRIVAEARSEGPRLEEAEIIVSGGRGLGAAENYKLVEELAEVLGGLAGASRPLIDDGWVDASLQVGLTGKITRPGLYLAAGISGASQHMAGCSAAKAIAAINSDPDAAIFRYARYGIVGDCLEILPELIRAARER
jgi:electron transfer flavoprotein alpha subunit